MAASVRSKASIWTHGLIDRIFLWLPFPDVDPRMVSFASVFLSILAAVLLRADKLWFFMAYLVALLLDGADGIIARKHNRRSREGYLCDVACDRLAEGIVMVNFLPWFALFVLNLFLSLFSIAKRKHWILPLRALFLAYYAVWALILP